MSLFISSTDTAWKATVKKTMQLGSRLKQTALGYILDLC